MTHMTIEKCNSCLTSDDVLGEAMTKTNQYGFWLEFGVADGGSLRRMTDYASKIKHNIPSENPQLNIVGFDSFEGLPEDWFIHKAGHFKMDNIPNVPGAQIVVGLFDATVMPWIVEQKIKPQITLVHIDCDLYQGAKHALTCVAPFLVPGSIIVFDELINYEGYEDHEWRALYEVSIVDKLFSFEWLIRAHGVSPRPGYIANDGRQVAIRIK